MNALRIQKAMHCEIMTDQIDVFAKRRNRRYERVAVYMAM